MKQKTPADFWAKVSVGAGDGCWLWAGGVGRDGYGQTMYQRGRFRSHQLALILSGMERPSAPRNQALHACDIPLCCNPSHLRWGTTQENTRDREERRKVPFQPAVGEKTRSAKLTEEAVRAILASTERGVDLARRYGVSCVAITHIRKNVTWKHIPRA